MYTGQMGAVNWKFIHMCVHLASRKHVQGLLLELMNHSAIRAIAEFIVVHASAAGSSGLRGMLRSASCFNSHRVKSMYIFRTCFVEEEARRTCRGNQSLK
jgi:hypothetical protein